MTKLVEPINENSLTVFIHKEHRKVKEPSEK